MFSNFECSFLYFFHINIYFISCSMFTVFVYFEQNAIITVFTYAQCNLKMDKTLGNMFFSFRQLIVFRFSFFVCFFLLLFVRFPTSFSNQCVYCLTILFLVLTMQRTIFNARSVYSNNI